MSNFDPNSVSGLVGLWDFKNGATTADTGLDDGIAQNGTFEGNAGASGDRAHFDGHNDWFTVDGDNGGGNDDPFDLSAGTIEVQFTQDQQVGSSEDVLVSRGEYDDKSSEGYLHIAVTKDNEVEIRHYANGENVKLETPKDIFEKGDNVNIKYTWDAATGVTLVVENLTTGTTTTVTDDTTGLDLDIGDNDDEHFTFGAREKDDGSYDKEFDGSIDYVAIYQSSVPDPDPDGVVDGEASGEVMELGYDDSNAPTDQGGDLITENADVIFGNGGDDTIDGEGGDDTIYGDSGVTGPAEREVFQWDEQPDFANNANVSDFTQNTGSANISFSIESFNGDHNQYETNQQNVDGLDDPDVSDTSSFESLLDNSGESGRYSWESDTPLQNVEFRVNDIDGDGVIRVRAFDENGNPVEVTLSDAGSGLTLSNSDGVPGNDTATSNDSNYTGDDSAEHSVLVTIAGPVSRWEVIHEQDGSNDSGINVTDIEFDVGGGFGEAGDDVITGGAGADQMFGEDGDDTFIVDVQSDGDGDVIDGGAGPDDTTDNDTLDLRGTGQVTIVQAADPNDAGAVAGTVTFEDGSVLTFEGIETILTDPQNEGPTANDDTVDVDEDDTVTFNPTANDTDPDGDPLEVIDISDPSNGTLIDNGDGTYTYEPDPNYNGPDSVTYTIQDPSGETSTATITFNVAPVNDAPDAVNDAYVTDEEVAITLTPLDNDTDVDGDDLEITGASVPSDQGTVTVAPAGKSIEFVPADDFFGDATISYSISDGNGGTDLADIVVTVNNINDDPVANDDVATTDEDTPVVIDLLGNDTDADGDTLEIASLDVDPAEGSVVDNGDGTVTFTPAPNYNGPATINYTVSDGNGGTDDGVATVSIGAVNDGPTANDDTETTDEDTPIEIFPLGNDTDPDGDDLTITGASVDASEGTVSVAPDGKSVTFTPAANYNGPATITYSITDGNGGTSSAEIDVTVNPVNDDPVAVDDLETTNEDEPVIVDLLGNDTDVDGDTLEIASLSVDPAEGSVVDNGDGTVTFTPAPNFNGPATITYTVSDGNGGTDEGEAVVSVGAVNDKPIAEDDAATTDEDTPVEIEVLDNDSDPDGDDLTVISATVPASEGTVDIAPDGKSIIFTPAADFNGDATITYTISDGNGLTDTAEVDVTVNPVGDAPVANDDDITTDEDTPITFDPTANDSDPDGDPVTVDSFTQPPNGTVTENPDGTLTYTPDPDYNGPDSFEVTVTDPDGNTSTSTVNVTVDPVDDAPNAVDDDITTDEDTPITFDPTANDNDPDGQPVEVDSFTQPTNGTVTQEPDGTLTYTPDPDYNGPDTFEVTVTDPDGNTSTSTVNVTVDPVDDAPNAVDDDITTDEDTPITFDPTANDSDPDGQPVEVDSFTQPTNGTVTQEPDGTLTYTPDPDYNGPDTFEVTVTDPDGNTSTSTVNVTVDPLDDAPNAVDDDITTDEDTPITFDPTANDSDPDGDPVTVDSFTQPPNGTVEQNPDGTLTYTPDPDYNGPDSFEVTVTDPDGNTATSTVNVTVDPVNDDPVAVDDSGTTPQATPVVIDLIGNDTDVDGDILSLEPGSATVPADQGTLVDNGDGTVTFTPAPSFVGDAEITYTVIDGNGGSDQGTATVTVTDVIGPVDGEDTGENMQPGYDDALGATNGGGDQIDGIDGNDDTIFGNGGDDTIDSGEGDDTVDGGDGDDVFEIANSGNGIDNDSIIGGEGDEDGVGDVLDMVDIEEDLMVDFTAPETGTVTDGTDTTSFEEIERIITGSGDDTITGSDGDDWVDSSGGDDSMLGGDGNDTLISGDGDDTIDGGEGNDSLVGGDEFDSITGGEGDDTIEGGRGDDELDGGAGNDSIVGGNDNDTITGGDGADTVEGGEGNNVIDTSGSSNLVDDKNGDGFGFAPYGPFPPAPADGNETDDADLVTTGSGNDNITTGDDADTIMSGGGNDTINSGIDNDSVDGGTGDDLITTGEGADTVDGGFGNDTIYGGLGPAFPSSTDIPDDGSGVFGPDPDTENGRDLIDGGRGNDLIYGEDDDDTIFGGNGADTLDGGIDDDLIYGEIGQDDLIGGQGADTMFGGDDRDEFFINEREHAFGDEIDGGTGGNDVDRLDLRGLGRFEIVNETVDADGDSTSGTVNFLDADGNIEGTLEFTEIENLIPCFTPGAQIATPRGEVSVEELQVGDRVITRDDGIQEIQWIGKKKLSAKDMLADPKLKPVMIKAGSLGNNLPERDVLVSPNHRMLIANENTQMLFDEREVLVAAKHLVGQPGVHMVDLMGTEYIHVMFERHQVILGDGAWTESFQPGDQTLGGFDQEQREEIFKLFPSLKGEKGRRAYSSARQSLKAFEARTLRETMGK